VKSRVAIATIASVTERHSGQQTARHDAGRPHVLRCVRVVPQAYDFAGRVEHPEMHLFVAGMAAGRGHVALDFELRGDLIASVQRAGPLRNNLGVVETLMVPRRSRSPADAELNGGQVLWPGGSLDRYSSVDQMDCQRLRKISYTTP
jgi:hypothetical protein